MTGYIQRLERLEKLAVGVEGVHHAYAIQAGREVVRIRIRKRGQEGECRLLHLAQP